MKEENKVYILATIFAETQSRFPWIDLRRFKILFDGWRQQGIRNGVHSGFFYTNAWRRGWIAPTDADCLRKYIGLR